MKLGRRHGLRAVLLDKDGTLLDFGASWTGIAREAAAAAAGGEAARVPALLRACGLDPETGRFRAGSAMVAGTAADVADCWLPLLPALRPSDRDALIDHIDAIFTAGATRVVPVDGLGPALAALHAGGWRLGVATMDNAEAAEATLTHLGLRDRFAFVCGWDSGHGTKPGPGMALAFCAALGLPPAAAVMVGDSVHDLEMGRAAGVGLTIGVLTGPATAEQLRPHADLVLGSVAELPALLGPAAG